MIMLSLKWIHKQTLSKTLASLGLIFLVVTSLAKGSTCPRDLFIGTHACFTAFTLSYQRMKQSQQKLCCGLDVETLRALCRAYVDSMACVDNVKRQCPATKHGEIEKALVNLDGAREELSGLCSDDTIVENYAMHQSCLTVAGQRSESCLAHHLEGRGRHIGEGTTRIRFLSLIEANTVDTFCRKMRSAISCVHDNVEYVCGDQAASLVPYLVRPMVRYSASCISGPSKHPTQRPFLSDNTFHHDEVPVDRGSRSSSSYRSMDREKGNYNNIDDNVNDNAITEKQIKVYVESETHDFEEKKPRSKNCSSVHGSVNVLSLVFLSTAVLARSIL